MTENLKAEILIRNQGEGEKLGIKGREIPKMETRNLQWNEPAANYFCPHKLDSEEKTINLR